MKIHHIVSLAAVAVTVAAAAAAQDTPRTLDPVHLALRSAEVHQACIDQLKHYTWRLDAKLSHDGELKFHVASHCRIDEKGNMVQDVDKAETTVQRKRGLRGRAQATNAEELGAFLDNVVAVTSSYLFMTKGEELDFFDGADITEGTGGAAGDIIVQATEVSVTGDKVTKWIDSETLYTSRITFETVVDEVPVSGEVLYRPIEGGPNVPRMVTINFPSKQGVVVAEFLDYAKQL